MRWGFRRIVVGVLTAGMVSWLPVLPASAINSENSSLAPERTEVGFLGVAADVTDDGVIDVLGGFCSGTMIDSDSFLTAAHCTDTFPSGGRFFVSLEQDLLSLFIAHGGLPPNEFIELFLANGWIVEGDIYRDFSFVGFTSSRADLHDIAVIDFANRETTPADVWTFTPAVLPSAGQLDAIGGRALDDFDWWAAGYGTQEAVRSPGGHTHPGGLVRQKAVLDFNTLVESWVHLGQNASRDLGGTCLGDSGGPVFVDIGDTLVLAGITSWGDIPCYATTVSYRTDTQSARAFLTDFVELP